MRKIILTIAILSLLPLSALAAVHYTRTPSGSLIYEQPTIDISFDDLSDIKVGCEPDCADLAFSYWGVYVYIPSAGENPAYAIPSPCVATTTKSLEYTFTNIPTNFENPFEQGLTIYLASSTEFCSAENITNDFDGWWANDPFIILSAPALSAISLPTGTAPDSLGFVGGQLADPGTYLLLLLIIGVPFTFYLIKKIRAVTPK